MDRKAKIERKTDETKIEIALKLDGTGFCMTNLDDDFNHYITQFAKYGSFDIALSAKGNNRHHLIEDTALCLGEAFLVAYQETTIERIGHAIVPMDDTIVTVAVDFSGRGYPNLHLCHEDEMVRHFLSSFAMAAQINLYVDVTGQNDHHKAEAIFKALGLAVKYATEPLR